MSASSEQFIYERMADNTDIPQWIEEMYKANDDQLNLIESLLHNCSLDDEHARRIEKGLFSYSEEEANDIITMLLNNQLDPIRDGLNYTQTDINNKLNKMK